MLFVDMQLEDIQIQANRNQDNMWEVKYGFNFIVEFDFVTMTDEQFATMMYLAIGGDDNNEETYARLHPMVRDCKTAYRPIP